MATTDQKVSRPVYPRIRYFDLFSHHVCLILSFTSKSYGGSVFEIALLTRTCSAESEIDQEWNKPCSVTWWKHTQCSYSAYLKSYDRSKLATTEQWLFMRSVYSKIRNFDLIFYQVCLTLSLASKWYGVGDVEIAVATRTRT